MPWYTTLYNRIVFGLVGLVIVTMSKAVLIALRKQVHAIYMHRELEFFAENIDCGYKLEPTRRGASARRFCASYEHP